MESMLMVTLEKIDPENFWEVIDLDVSEEQKDLVLSNSVSIAQAYVQPECIPLMIRQDGVPVGFAMYCIDNDDGEYWIYRLMVDQRYQHRGIGRQAMELLIAEIKKDTTHHKIFLGVDLAGDASVALYKSLGFVFNDQVFGKEHIMLLDFEK